MYNTKAREIQRIRRHKRIRKKISGKDEMPRLVVRRSLKNIYAQLVNDKEGKTLFSLSTLDKQIKEKFPYGGNMRAAQFLGEVFAQRAKEKGFQKVVFDRGGYLYHGRVKAFAEGLRKGGLIL